MTSFINGLFGDVFDLRFNTSVKDMYPTCYRDTSTGYSVTCKTLGIDEKDIKIDIDDKYISLDGATEFEGYTYSVHFKIPIEPNMIPKIKEIKYKTFNGLTVIYIDIDKPQKKKIEIKKI